MSLVDADNRQPDNKAGQPETESAPLFLMYLHNQMARGPAWGSFFCRAPESGSDLLKGIHPCPVVKGQG
jgi:hypothetical protein